MQYKANNCHSPGCRCLIPDVLDLDVHPPGNSASALVSLPHCVHDSFLLLSLNLTSCVFVLFDLFQVSPRERLLPAPGSSSMSSWFFPNMCIQYIFILSSWCFIFNYCMLNFFLIQENGLNREESEEETSCSSSWAKPCLQVEVAYFKANLFISKWFKYFKLYATFLFALVCSPVTPGIPQRFAKRFCWAHRNKTTEN